MSKWVKIGKRLPEDDRQVIAYSGNASSHSIQLASYHDNEWWWTRSIKFGGVTKWMNFPEEPKDFEYWMNRLRNWLNSRKQNAQQASDWMTGRRSINAQLSKKPVFYRDASGKIMSGLPEHLPAPYGFQKIVCNNVFEAERFSELQRRQERVEHRAEQERRSSIEVPMLDEIRSERRTLIANARNNLNRDFLLRAEQMSANRRPPTEYERESFLHAEGYEQGR